jgi:hypothetical protein
MRRTIRLVIDLSNRYSKNPYVDFFVMVTVNILLSVALLGNLSFVRYSSFSDFVIFGFLVAMVDSLFRDAMLQRYPKFILTTFGFVMLIPAVVSLALVNLMLMDRIIFPSTEQYLGFIVIYLVIRKLISFTLLFQLYRFRMYKRMKKKEIKDAQL